MQGVSLFATHQFEKAEAVLKEAEKADAESFGQLGARYLESCAEYVKLWKDEQAIRAKEAKADDLPRVKFETTKGDIVIELFENEAPNTVANFISLVEGKKYDGTKFHRVIPTFMAQGGDPNSLDDDPSNDGGGGPGYRIECEVFAKNARKHFAGSLSMAHAGKDTGGSQFFLTHLPTAHLNPNTARQSGHTVFGRVIEGLDVAVSLRVGDKIESATVVRKRDHEYKPKTLAGKKGF
ncbi:MAG: peptidylprolyl isomerase [Planctomycetales bacterium]|nr:peptidylprolyl isomerase [Planctomycetales bacterium]